VYTAGGEVLMGTLRWEKEAEERSRQTLRHAEFEHKRRVLKSAEANTTAQIAALELELDRQQAELALYADDNNMCNATSSDREQRLREMRSADPPQPAQSGHMRVARPAARASARKNGNGAG
jgi:circadian clock protein KaiC